MTNRRWLLGAALSLLAVFSLSCGGGRSSATNVLKPGVSPSAGAQPGNPLSAALPAPGTLIDPSAKAAAGATLLCHNGAETDAALAVQNAALDGTALDFAPHWTTEQPAPDGLALALYRFTVTGYHGATDLHVDWTGAGGASQRFLAVADFPRNRWNFLPVAADGSVALTSGQFADGTAPGCMEFLAVTISTGSQSSRLSTIRIGANPGPFSITGVTPTTVAQYKNVVFTPTFTGDEPVSWEWTFDGAAISGTYTGRMPLVFIQNLGQHNAKVTATDAHGVQTVFPFQLTVLPQNSFAPNLISVMPNAGETGSQSSIIATADGGGATSCSWNFGGGATPNTSTDQYPVVTFGAPGTYDASVTFTNLHGSSTMPFKLYVVEVGGQLPPCLYSAGTNTDPALPGMTVSYGVQNVGGDPTTYSWDFGGGAVPNTSTDAIPSVALPTAGLFHGTVTASNAVGSSTVGFTLSVLQPAAPHLTSVTIGFDPQTSIPLNLTPLGDGGGVVSYSWNFGGAASPNTSSEYIPQIVPLAPGTYHASVTAVNSAGSSTFPFDLVVTDPPAPHLTGLSTTDLTTTIATGMYAQNSGGPVSSWSWEFGGANGADDTSTAGYPTVTPLQAGVYHGTVTATNISGSSSLDFTLTVTDMAPPTLDAVFPTELVAGSGTCFFASTTCGFPMTFTWDFGGGCTPNTSTDQFPTVTAVTTPGTYSGTVTATNAGGSTTLPFTLTVASPQ